MGLNILQFKQNISNLTKRDEMKAVKKLLNLIMPKIELQ
jgi:hypothetical protein